MYAAYNGYPQVVKLLLGRQTCHMFKHFEVFLQAISVIILA